MSRNFAYLNICHNNQHIDCEFVDIIGTRRQDNLSSRMQHLNWQVTAAARYSPVASELVLVTAPGPGEQCTVKSVLAAQLRLTAAARHRHRICILLSSFGPVRNCTSAKLNYYSFIIFYSRLFKQKCWSYSTTQTYLEVQMIATSGSLNWKTAHAQNLASVQVVFFVISYNITFMQPILSIYGKYNWW